MPGKQGSFCSEMSSLPFEDIVASPTFKFLVGKEQKPMYLHNALVARHSKTLDAMINGQMSEAHNGYATLDDVDPNVFAHFSQWLYTGRYESRGMDGRHERSETITSFPSDILAADTADILSGTTLTDSYEPTISWPQNKWPASRKTSTPRGQKFYAADASKQQNLWAQFSGGSTSEMPRKTPPSDRAPHTNYNNYYLLHAQVYCFADKYGVLGLQQIAIDKLKQNLIDCVLLSPQRIAALIELITFTGDNTVPPEVNRSDRLRDLIVQYTAITFEILFESDDFQEMLASNGDFFLEVVTRLMRRLD